MRVLLNPDLLSSDVLNAILKLLSDDWKKLAVEIFPYFVKLSFIGVVLKQSGFFT